MVRLPAEHSGARASLRGWLPAAIAFGVFFQVAWLGLRPALAEERRLTAAESELAGRLARAEDEGREIARLLEAQADPIYRERERRALLDPARPGPGTVAGDQGE